MKTFSTNIAVHCPTIELARRVVDLAYDNNYQWLNHKYDINMLFYDEFLEDTCYSFDNYNLLFFWEREEYVKRGKVVIPAEEFLKEHKIYVI